MSETIWPVVTENLAEQIAASQAGRVHPSQLLPFLPMSLELIERTLDEMTLPGRIEKESVDGLTGYTFSEFLDHPVRPFAPDRGVYSDDPIEDDQFSAVSPKVKAQIQEELAPLAAADRWPADAIWQHELIYLMQNLSGPLTLSAISAHARLPVRKVEDKLKSLQKLGAIRFDMESGTYSAPPMLYPKAAYQAHHAFIRQFPGARKEEEEIRLIKALFGAFIVFAITILLAITAKLPFPLLLIGGSVVATINFIRILKAAPKPLPEL